MEIVGKNYRDTSEVPKDRDLFYRCTNCGGIIPSLPRDNVGCECGNMSIDIEQWKFFVEDMSKLEVVKK